MEKMENESKLQVTFSKRRNGLIKKASELSTRCGAKSALVVFSPNSKPYSFDHPNIERVISRFLGDQNDHNLPRTTDHQLRSLEAKRKYMNQLNLAINQEKELKQITKQVGKIKQTNEFNHQVLLDQLKGEVLDFKNKLRTDDGKDKSFIVTPSSFLGANPNLGGARKDGHE